MTNGHLKLLERIHAAEPDDPVPTREELRRHLEARTGEIGKTALVEFAYLQAVASWCWGLERTSHFARVLRDARVATKPPRQAKWDKAERAVLRLPALWRQPMLCQIQVSRRGRKVLGGAIWSADHCLAVTAALARWSEYCVANRLDPVPTGASLDRYGQCLIQGMRTGAPVTTRTVSDYLSRILAGFCLIDPQLSSTACEFVLRDWDERARREGPSMKTGGQLVGASRIYDLGFDVMAAARRRRMRGLHAARDFRNGLILSVGAALPQRARALSSLAFDRTLFLPGDGLIHVSIPARMLKLREHKKGGEPFDRVFRNEGLATALQEYRGDFRPLFDDGDCLFPSMLSPGAAISEGQIGVLVGNMTKAAFGVRVSVHRIRDNVATEASEALDGGGRAASRLLDHRDPATTARYYDHSVGMEATRDFEKLVSGRQSEPVDLLL